MIYDSPEIIPAKLYFKILETGKISLLSNELLSIEKVKKAWQKLEEEYSTKKDSKRQDKIINISKRIEGLKANIEFVSLAVYYLRNLKDNELIDKLKSKGYKFNWIEKGEETEITEAIFQDDLDRIERESQALELKIKILEKPIPKQSGSNGEQVTFDETVLMYASFTGLGYVNPNEIPLTQYDAMIVNGNKKMKALESNNK